MTGPATTAAPPSALPPAERHRVLIVLCATEVTSWGVLYYAFPVLAPTISASAGWSLTTVMAAFTVSQVVAAVAGIPVGRWLDRSGPRPVMTAGSLLAAPALVCVATAQSVAMYFLGWVVAGAAMAAVLYQPAFAALTTWWGQRRVKALTALTLVAGLASTIFAPLTAVLVNQIGWRNTYLVLACALAVVTIPAHLFGLRGSWAPPATRTSADRGAAAAARSRQFILLAIAASVAAFALYAVLVNLVPLLIERGMSVTAAAFALGMSGVGQLCGRLGYPRLAAATSVRLRTVVIFGAGAATTALLAVIPGPAVLLIATAALAGAARGQFTLLQATAVTDRWGPAQYGHLNGLLSAPIVFAIAMGPWAGSAIADTLGGYPPVFAVLAASAAFAALLAAATDPDGSQPSGAAAAAKSASRR